jgi:hypothetical protein
MLATSRQRRDRGQQMGNRFDYYVSGDGTPGDDVVDTTWLDPVVHLGRLRAVLTGEGEDLRLRKVRPHVDRVPDDVRDALAAVPLDGVSDLGDRWAATDELTADAISPAEAKALLHDLVALCVAGRETGQGLYVART